VRILFVTLGVLFSCSTGQSPSDDKMSGRELSFIDDIGPEANDIGKGLTLDSAVPTPDMDGICGVSRLKINEVQTTGASGAPGDEWIEIFNPCTNAVDASGAKLVYRTATNTSATDSAQIAILARTIGARGYLLIAGPQYASGPAADQTFTNETLNFVGGAVALRDASGTRLDSVGWGTANNPFVETASTFSPDNGKSIARHPDGADQDDNSKDFVVGTATPRAAN
jgi:hypothetical protein